MEYFERHISSNPNSIHLNDLAQAAAEIGFLNYKVLEHINILYKNETHGRKCRYLILHMSKSMTRNRSVAHDLLQVLQHPRIVSERIYDHLCTYLRKKINSSEFLNARPDNVLLSVEGDLPFLFTHLSNYSYKWKNIGRCLLSSHALQNIELRYINDFDSCLYEVLNRWLLTEPSPTLELLRDALASEAVGLGRCAFDLERSMITFLEKHCDSNLSDKKYDLPELVLFGCDDQIDLQDSAVAVLLEVNVKNKYSDSTRLQWYRDEMLLRGESNYILSIVVKDITAESTYRCMIDERLKSNSISISVRTPIDQYKTFLIEKYDSEPEVIPDTWPDVEQSTYINLAILSGREIKTECSFTRQSIQGDFDDVLLDKSSTDYKSAFMSLEQSSRILVVGRPGSGKTTLVHRISQDWAKNKIEWKSVRLLFLVHLRGFRSNPSIGLKEIVAQYFKDHLALEIICDYAEKHHGLGYCFILDGLDEYQPHDNETFIFKLINKHQLPKAVVIVSSRPAAVAMYRKIATKEIEVLGFFKKEIEKYILSYRFSSKSSNSNLIRYLNQHPNVHHMCYLPIQSAMICFLFEVHDGLPSTETKIYKEFTKHAILRTLYRYKSSSERVYLESIHSLKGPEKDTFRKICQLAFEKTRSSLQILEQTEVDRLCETLELEDTLGLITVDFKATKCGFQNIYTFCHLTFQEFLAACHILFQEQTEQMEIIKSYGPMDHMQVVFKFFCGLVKFDEDCGLFIKLLACSNFKPLFRVQCAFETQQSQVCDYVASPFLQFKDLFMTSSDFTALGYVIAHVNQNIVNGISFDCSPSEECIEAFDKALKWHSASLKFLEFRGCAKGHLQAVVRLITVLPSLEVLSIADTEQDINDIDSISSILRHQELKILKFCCESGDDKHKPLPTDQLQKLGKTFTLNCSRLTNICFSASNKNFAYSTFNKNLPFFFFSILSETKAHYTNCDFSNSELKALSVDLMCGSICTELSLINCNINDEKATLLAEALKTKCFLKILILTANKIGDKGAIAIAECLPQSEIQHVDLSLNQICDGGASALLEATSMKDISLSLFGNNISFQTASKDDSGSMKVLSISGRLGDTGIASVKSYFNKEMTLETLQLRSCGNSFGGLESIISMMKKCSFLLSVTLVDCNVDDGGAELLASYVKNYSGLHSIDLSRNKMSSVGAKVLLEALKSCSQLEVLNLNNNRIEAAGALSLSEYLYSCKLIKNLQLCDNCICDAGVKALDAVIQGNTQLRILKLGGNLISDIGAGALANSLKQCVDLTEIDLSRNLIGRNGLSALTDCLQNCTALHDINLSSNNLGGGGKVLGQCLQVLQNLIRIDVSGNYIDVNGGAEAVAGSLKNCENIESLNLSDNKISDAGAVALSDCLTGCSKLAILNMSYNDISSSGFSVLAYLIRYCNKLITLDLSHNNINFMEYGAEALANALKTCTFLSSLDLSYNKVCNEGLSALVGFLKQSKTIQELALQKCGISSFYLLHDCFKDCENLHTLNFGDNDMTRKNPEDLETFLFLENCSNLSTLVLCNNHINTTAAVALSNSLKRCSHLRKLDLNDNDFGEGISSLVPSLAIYPNLCSLYLRSATISKKLISCLKSCGNLHILDISKIVCDCPLNLVDLLKCCQNLRALFSNHNKITDSGVINLAKFSSNLLVLDLSYNQIADNGAKALALCLKTSGNVRVLILGHNGIGDVGVTALADSFISCYNLQVLDLSSNKFGNKGIESLSASLRCCFQLKSLDLSYNSMSLSGAEVLANSLKSCMSLNSLHLKNVEVCTDGAIALAFCFKKLYNLQKLSIGYNNFTDDIAMAFAYALKGSCNLRELDLTSITDIDYHGPSISTRDQYYYTTSVESYSSKSHKRVETIACALKSCENLRVVKCSEEFSELLREYGIPVQVHRSERRRRPHPYFSERSSFGFERAVQHPNVGDLDSNIW